ALHASVCAENILFKLNIPIADNQVLEFLRARAFLLAYCLKDYAGTEHLLGLLLRVDPDDVWALDLRAICYEQLNNASKAKADRLRAAHIKESQGREEITSTDNLRSRVLQNEVRQFVRGSSDTIRGIDVEPNAWKRNSAAN
ncbi:MAG TPA: hypothetical protein V6D17_23295, partial [Candidatus Obscuribacterales bacterium]